MTNASYKVGGPIFEEDMNLYIERGAEDKVISHLRSNSYVLIIEPRQQGKTSLINYLMLLKGLKNILFIYIDISSLDGSSIENWYSSLWNRG